MSEEGKKKEIRREEGETPIELYRLLWGGRSRVFDTCTGVSSACLMGCIKHKQAGGGEASMRPKRKQKKKNKPANVAGAHKKEKRRGEGKDNDRH